MTPIARPLALVGLLLAGTALDGAWLSRLPAGLAPDLTLLVLISAAVRGGLVTGALLGATAGYLRDLASGTPLGIHTFAYLIVGIAAGSAIAMLDFDQRFVPAATGAVATMGLSLLTAGVVIVTGLAPVDWFTLVLGAAPAGGVNALLARPVDAVVRAAERAARRRYPTRAIGYRIFR